MAEDQLATPFSVHRFLEIDVLPARAQRAPRRAAAGALAAPWTAASLPVPVAVSRLPARPRHSLAAEPPAWLR